MNHIKGELDDRLTEAALRNVVFLIGAGFSRSISQAMPVMADLGDRISKRLGSPFGKQFRHHLAVFGNDVEEVLAFLYSPPPYVETEVSLEHQALATRVVAAIRDEIVDAERSATETDPPGWLQSLIRWWHKHRTRIVTLNYDSLIERAALPLLHTDTNGDYTPESSLAAPLPPVAMRTGGTWGRTRVESFTLAKLHGSASWYWPQSRSGPADPIYLDHPATWPGGQAPAVDAAYRLAGLEPAIVPPLGAKDELISNLTLRAQWQAAKRNPSIVVICGYSLPASDRLVRQLLAERWGRANIVVADIDVTMPQHIAECMRAVPRSGIPEDAERFVLQANPLDPMPDLVGWLESVG
mgnify:CR=1 FL=1